MYGTRYIIRPAGGRVARACAPAASRGMSCVPGPFFARQSYPQSDFNQLFRLFDESSRAFDNFWPAANAEASRRTFAPRFDVQEVDGGYELKGELPGVEAQDLQVEFTDPKTLVISGRTEREATSGTPPQAVQAAPEQQQQVEAKAADTSDTASVHSEGSSSSYQRPTVEDDYVDAGEEASSAPAKRADTTVNTTAAAEEQPAAAATSEQPQQPQNHYWVSERSVGQFSRTFTFPVNIDQDAVTASLKNGLLNITVPKAKAPEVRRIQVE